MPYRRFDWHARLKRLAGEYRAARTAVDRLVAQVRATPDLLAGDIAARDHLGDAQANLEGTYIVRLFAAFEAALRSYDRSRHDDPTRHPSASALIDETGGRRARAIPDVVRRGAHRVRVARNHWAHESDADSEPLTIDDARSRLQHFLSYLPDEW